MDWDVVVVGSYNLDLVFEVDRLPAPGETRLSHARHEVHGGKGSNQAVQAARCGARTAVVAAVGCDGAGEGALGFWRQEGVDAGHAARLAGAATGTAVILVDSLGENAIVVSGGANQALSPTHADAAAPTLGSAHVTVSQLEIPQETILRAFQIARAGGGLTVLNAAPAPASLDPRLIAETDILVVNEGEGAALAGSHDPDEMAARLLPRLGRGLVVTLGAAGARLYERDGRAIRAPAHKVSVVDTTGAGDAFIGAFAAGLAQSGSLEAALGIGMAAGALACRSLGATTSFRGRAEILALAAG